MESPRMQPILGNKYYKMPENNELDLIRIPQ